MSDNHNQFGIRTGVGVKIQRCWPLHIVGVAISSGGPRPILDGFLLNFLRGIHGVSSEIKLLTLKLHSNANGQEKCVSSSDKENVRKVLLTDY